VKRVAAGLIFAILLAGCACTQEKTDDRQTGQTAKVVQVDPMTFVIVYRTEIDRLLQKHTGDCEGALAALVRFVADQRQAFHKLVEGKPADWQPNERQSQPSIDLLMEFASQCPEQAARLNEAVHSICKTADDS